ncbi:hypothetical protein D3C80_1718680 [compost metagenome]
MNTRDDVVKFKPARMGVLHHKHLFAVVVFNTSVSKVSDFLDKLFFQTWGGID